jgi:hypothetical protein
MCLQDAHVCLHPAARKVMAAVDVIRVTVEDISRAADWQAQSRARKKLQTIKILFSKQHSQNKTISLTAI